MAVRAELGPSAMILESGVERIWSILESGVARIWSISSRNGMHVRGKAETQEVAIPMRCTP